MVAHEFVKQYYTLLNAAPEQLHRFYSHNSSFIHGDDQAAVTGQTEIHKKILSLNFENCHARICQVDSQSSVSGSVVVQVIGELSNGGQPMRRFVQSFVLAPQSHNKYYVHVDIFRYQDNNGAVPTNNEDDNEEESNLNDEQCIENGATDNVDYELSCSEQNTLTVDEVKQQTATVDSRDVTDSSQPLIEPTVVDDDEHIAAAAVVDTGNENGTVVDEPVSVEPTPASDVTGEMAEGVCSSEEKEPVVVGKQSDEIEKKVEETATVVGEPEPTPAVTKPMTWAAMASKNVPSSNTPTSVTPSTAVSRTPNNNNQSATTVKATPEVDSSSSTALVNGSSNKETPMSAAGDCAPRRQGSSGLGAYPDNQQIFVGNLPQHLSDQEITAFFEKFGAVIDFRINRKPASSHAVNNLGQKNFGFMAFDKAETVQKVLSARPLSMGKHRLNIEEKKPKEELAARSRAARYSTPSSNGSTGRPGPALVNGSRRGGGRGAPTRNTPVADES
jgi:hypothetical protein